MKDRLPSAGEQAMVRAQPSGGLLLPGLATSYRLEPTCRAWQTFSAPKAVILSARNDARPLKILLVARFDEEDANLIAIDPG